MLWELRKSPGERQQPYPCLEETRGVGPGCWMQRDGSCDLRWASSPSCVLMDMGSWDSVLKPSNPEHSEQKWPFRSESDVPIGWTATLRCREGITRLPQPSRQCQGPFITQSRLSDLTLLISPEAPDFPECSHSPDSQTHLLTSAQPRLLNYVSSPKLGLETPILSFFQLFRTSCQVCLQRHVIHQSMTPLLRGITLRWRDPGHKHWGNLGGAVAFPMCLMPYPERGRPQACLCLRQEPRAWQDGCLRSAGDLHAAHAVREAVHPEAGHVILLDLHGVALEVGAFKQADLVLLGILGKERLDQACEHERGKEKSLSGASWVWREKAESAQATVGLPGIATVQPGRALLICEKRISASIPRSRRGD